MRKLLALTLIGLACVTARAQNSYSTNLNVTLRQIYTNMPLAVQAETEALYLDYRKAVNSAPAFKGVETNYVVADGLTNAVVTTNHAQMAFTPFFVQFLCHEKIGRHVGAQQAALRGEIYSKVGKTVVAGWSE
jgi:hypothetical protein